MEMDMKASTKLRKIRNIMFPNGNMEHEWSPETLDDIAQILHTASLTKAQKRALDSVILAYPVLTSFDAQTGERCLFVRTFLHLWESMPNDRHIHGLGARLMVAMARNRESSP